MRWHIVTPEYPPSAGGVGDYTALVAAALADAGDGVDVWVGHQAAATAADTWRVHVLPDRFADGSRRMLSDGWRADPGIVLVQYVPSVFGQRGANLAFCRWLIDRRRAGQDVRVMFHEPYFYYSWQKPWRNGLAFVQRRMARMLIRASSQIYLSSANWYRYLGPYGATKDAVVLPIPSTVPGNPGPDRVAAFRAQFGAGAGTIVGHFGTFGAHVTGVLTPIVEQLLRDDASIHLALIGANSGRYRDQLVTVAPAIARRIHATGTLAAGEIAAALQACDIALQPYPDGVTTRRTSVMAPLRNGVATVTTDGPLTEDVWRSGEVVLTAVSRPSAAAAAIKALVASPSSRRDAGRRGRDLYLTHFDLGLTVRALRSPEPAVTR